MYCGGGGRTHNDVPYVFAKRRSRDRCLRGGDGSGNAVVRLLV